MKPTPEQIAAAKAWMKGEPTMEQEAILREFNPCCATSHNAARILLAALEAAEADGARLDWLNRQSDIVYYDGTHGTVWNIGVEGEDRTLCVRTAIDQAMKKDAARKEART